MNEPERTFGDRLAALERPDPAFKQRYERQVQNMLQNKLSPIKRIGFVLLALVGLGATIYYGGFFFVPRRSSWEYDLLVRFFMIPAFFVSIIWTILTGWAAVAGSSPRSQRPWIAATALAMVFFYFVTLAFMFVVPLQHEESRALLGTQLALMAFFMLNTVGLCVILGVLYRTRFDSQERLLKIEYQLAALSERMGGLPHGETKQ